MQILIIVHQFMPEFFTGTETVAFNLAKAAQRAGHRVTVLTCALGDGSGWRKNAPGELWTTSVDGVPVYAIPSAIVPDPLGVLGADSRQIEDLVRGFLDSHPFDIVHIMHSLRMLPAVKAVSDLDLPYVVTLTDFFPMCYRINLIRVSGELCNGAEQGRACERHCPIGNYVRKRQALFYSFLAGAQERVACSGFVQRQYCREFPNLAFRIMPHGVDGSRIAASRQLAASASLTFGYLGTISAAKGAALLAHAFADAQINDAQLEIVGPVYGNMDELAKIQAVANENPALVLRDAVPPNGVPDVLSRFDVLCVPSQVPETFSLVLHQGFLAGLPALVSDLGNPAEVVAVAACGRVISASDREQWGTAMREIAADRSLLTRWRANIPMPLRIEEEAFLYEHIYRRSVVTHSLRGALGQ